MNCLRERPFLKGKHKGQEKGSSAQNAKGKTKGDKGKEYFFDGQFLHRAIVA